MRLMIHEHNDTLRSVLLDMLRGETSRCVAVSDPEDAIGPMVGSVDVLLLDLDAPQPDMLWLCRQIRKSQPHLGILAMSTRGSVESICKALAAGADHLLVKPLCLVETKAHVKRAAERSFAFKQALKSHQRTGCTNA